MITGARKRILYLLYGISAAVFFMVIRFPSDTLSAYLASRLAVPAAGVQVAIAKVRPAFPPGLQLRSVDLLLGRSRLFGAERITLRPALLTVFDPVTTFSVRGKLHGGTLAGSVDLDRKRLSRLRLDMRLAGLRIKKGDAVQKILRRQVSGTVDATASVDRLKSESDPLKIQLAVSDGRIDLLPAALDIAQLAFKQINADLSAASDRILIRTCTFRGEQMDGSLSGSLLLRHPIGESVIDVRGQIRPHHRFLKSIQKMIPGGRLNTKRMADKGVPIRLGGTLNKPNYALGG